ncbi:MAG: hypothetical protein JO366_04660, partial [Methylobacteriaceae bacterium]|nr:hypothetical protein [Methylobacteriaceae bacterium]MBV9244086.1 hypothetical protein [Methylobacteriaceae bacterium]
MRIRSVADWVRIAALSAAALVELSVAALADGPGTWVLDSNILVLNKTTGVTILSDTHGPEGGSVRIKLDGSVLGNYCDPGFEEMQFDWQFARDIHQLSEGDVVPATVSGKILRSQAPCNGDLAAVSGIWVWSGDAPISDDLYAQVDGDRIFTKIDQQHAWAGKDPHSVADQLFVRVGQPRPEPPLAYFGVEISMRGGG